MAIQHPLDGHLLDSLKQRLNELEEHFEADVVFFYGEIHPSLVRLFRDFIEQLQGDDGADRLVIFLNTPGGSAETVEKMVEVVRYHYGEVFFVVPDYAMSAGTIFCTSGSRMSAGRPDASAATASASARSVGSSPRKEPSMPRLRGLDCFLGERPAYGFR